MAIILNIDTATENATISISEKDKVIDAVTNRNQKDHASFLQPAIKNLLQRADLSTNKLNAVAVTAGHKLIYRIAGWYGKRKRLMLCFEHSYDNH